MHIEYMYSSLHDYVVHDYVYNALGLFFKHDLDDNNKTSNVLPLTLQLIRCFPIWFYPVSHEFL